MVPEKSSTNLQVGSPKGCLALRDLARSRNHPRSAAYEEPRLATDRLTVVPSPLGVPPVTDFSAVGTASYGYKAGIGESS